MSVTGSQRREVDYENLRDVVTDAERVARADADTLGQWSKGQIFEHLARTIDKSVTGFDNVLSWPMRLVATLMAKKKILNDKMPSGFQLKGKQAEELAPGETSTEEGLRHLQEAIGKYLNETQRAIHPAFGKLTADEWTRLHMQHCRLHMSFICEPDDAS